MAAISSPAEQAADAGCAEPSPVELDAAYLFCSDGFQIGALMVPTNGRQRNALEFLLREGVVYLDTQGRHVGYRRHGGESINCSAYGRDLLGTEKKLSERWVAQGVLIAEGA